MFSCIMNIRLNGGQKNALTESLGNHKTAPTLLIYEKKRRASSYLLRLVQTF